MAGEAQAGQALGGAIGSIWGPAGAALGSTLGGAVGGLAEPPRIPGSGGPTNASSATYGTSIGNDGWSINFGGTQVATPTSTTTSTYPTDTQRNPLNSLQPVYVGSDDYAPMQAGLGVPSWALYAGAALLLVAVLRKHRK